MFGGSLISDDTYGGVYLFSSFDSEFSVLGFGNGVIYFYRSSYICYFGLFYYGILITLAGCIISSLISFSSMLVSSFFSLFFLVTNSSFCSTLIIEFALILISVVSTLTVISAGSIASAIFSLILLNGVVDFC